MEREHRNGRGTRDPGGSRMCGKYRAYKHVFLDLWQWLDLPAIFRICGK